MRVGVVGCGNICNLAHIPALNSIKDKQIVAACDIVVNRAENTSKLLNAGIFTSDFDELLTQNIDVVDLCVPTHEHATLAVKALKEGVNVICEKPLANNIENAKKILRALKNSDAKLFVGQIRRFDGRWTKIHESLKNIGNLKFLRRSERSFLPYKKGMWQWNPKESGHGVITDLGIHCTDFANWYFNELPEEVFSQGKFIKPWAKKNKCFDLSTITLKYKSGKTAYIDVGWCYPEKYSSFYANLDVIGDKGKIKYSDGDANPMVDIGKEVSFPRYSPLLSSDIPSFAEELSHFFECIRKNKNPIVSHKDAYNALLICQNAVKSINKNKPIKLGGFL